tara:strand:+ start:4872 stop:5990 length:1119 start_codon:yes stop_codon:yes gene_type:complete
MPRTLVIHVGAQKCASSSLQASLRLVQKASNERLAFCFLNPAQLRAADLSLSKQKDGAFNYIDRVLAAQSVSQVVVSHEMLGNRPALVAAIAERAVRHFSFDRVVISGYSRLQSNYHVSAFAQWYFRDRKKLLSDVKVFRELGLPWRKFTAQERSLFVLALSGKDRSWYANYKRFTAGVSALADCVKVVSCHIPTRALPFSLLEHFVRSTGLSLGLVDLASMDVRKNQSFHPVLIHGLSTFFSDLPVHRQSFFPGPHEGNRWLFRVCDRLMEDADDGVISELEGLFSPDFARCLLDHLDCRTAEDNKNYCEMMSVDYRYFEPSGNASLQSDGALKERAAQIAEERSLKQIERFNRAVENACFRAARLEIVST